jgi:two-component system OmpR family sensor kinase
MRSWARSHLLEIAWVLWAIANVIVTLLVVSYETVPFHFVWISLTLLYGYRLWRIRHAMATLAAVCVATGGALGWAVVHGSQGLDELTEVPLMAAAFVVVVWHVERRQAALRAVERAAAREREFVRAASHHLKTPIAIARALASLMMTDQGATVSQKDLGELVEELDRLGLLADDMLLLATADQVHTLVLDDVDLEDLIVGSARRWTRTQDRRWTVESIDGILRGDRHRLDCALDAVIENAVRATSEGDWISIRSWAEDNVAVVDISDSGVGISADALPHVFDRFWSSSNGNSSSRGTGLGLAIVRALVEAHGGSVGIASAPGRGTTVSIRLPGLQTPAGYELGDPVLADTA